MSGDQSRSLGKGSAAPGPVPAGLIRLYSMRFCPYAQRARLVLRAKGISHEVININLKNKPDWFFEKNPSGLVPTLETNKGELIWESPITCEYLDEAFPGKKLMPSDPYERACQKMLLEDFSKITSLVFKHLLAVQDGQDTTALKAEIAEKFGKLEEALSKRKTVFYGGDSVSMIDYMIWPWFERLELFQLKDSLNHTPKLQCWMEAMKEDPAVKATITDPQTYKNYLQLYLKNSPEAYSSTAKTLTLQPCPPTPAEVTFAGTIKVDGWKGDICIFSFDRQKRKMEADKERIKQVNSP